MLEVYGTAPHGAPDYYRRTAENVPAEVARNRPP